MPAEPAVLTTMLRHQWYGKHREIQSWLPTLRLLCLLHCLLILFKSVCINPAFALPLVLLFHIIGTFTFIFPNVLSCACLLCVAAEGGARARCARP